MPNDGGFHPNGYILQARTPRQTNLWGPFKTADEAAHWATTNISSGAGQWVIRPLWDPKMAQADA
jgi:hypothetical protein